MIAMVSTGPVRARGSEVQKAKVGMGAFPEEARKFGGPNRAMQVTFKTLSFVLRAALSWLGFPRCRQAPSSGRSPELPIQSVPHLPLISITTDHYCDWSSYKWNHTVYSLACLLLSLSTSLLWECGESLLLGTMALHGYIKIGASPAADGPLADFQQGPIMNTEVMAILR